MLRFPGNAKRASLPGARGGGQVPSGGRTGELQSQPGVMKPRRWMMGSGRHWTDSAVARRGMPKGWISRSTLSAALVSEANASGQSRPLGVVTVFVPPAILDEVQAVFHLPMAANVGVKLGWRDRARIEAGHEIAAFTQQKSTIARSHFTIGADGDLAVGNVQTLADILGVVQVDPNPAGIAAAPLFSIVSWAGRSDDTSAKHVFNASSMSGWLALT